MVRHDVARLLEPERRELREHFALVGNARAEDIVEGGDPVGGDEQQAIVDLVDVAYFALAMRPNSVQACVDDRGSKRHSGAVEMSWTVAGNAHLIDMTECPQPYATLPVTARKEPDILCRLPESANDNPYSAGHASGDCPLR